jgi:hypothetical protein
VHLSFIIPILPSTSPYQLCQMNPKQFLCSSTLKFFTYLPKFIFYLPFVTPYKFIKSQLPKLCTNTLLPNIYPTHPTISLFAAHLGILKIFLQNLPWFPFDTTRLSSNKHSLMPVPSHHLFWLNNYQLLSGTEHLLALD